MDNVHYDLTESDLEVCTITTSGLRILNYRHQELFSRKGRVLALSIRYDRAGRSTGTAFVTYETLSSAKVAIREYDGANANGQPIHLTLVSSGPSAPPARSRNPFDTAQRPSRSLFERISTPRGSGSGDYDVRSRSHSPRRHRVSDVSKPPPDYIDRYVPGPRSRSQQRSSRPAGASGLGRRRLDSRRDDGARGDQGRARAGRDGRPRKTQEELDAEMEDYWGDSKGAEEPAQASGGAATDGRLEQPAISDEADIMMVE